MKKYLLDLLAKIQSIPMSLLNIVSSLIEGISKQVGTTKGAITLAIIVAVILDIALGGTVGVIGFTIAKVQSILLSLAQVMKVGGWQLIVLILVIYMVITKK